MKQYKGKLSAFVQELIKKNSQKLARLIQPKGLNRVANTSSLFTLEESLALNNPGLSKEEIQAWVWYRRKSGIPMLNFKKYFTEPSATDLKKWVNNRILFHDPTKKGELVPFAIFVFGNLYEKIGKLNQQKETIIENFGASVFQNHIETLENLKPKVISITNPIAAERPVILAISETAKTFTVDSIKDIAIDGTMSLQDAYEIWLKNLDESSFKGTKASEIISYYLNNNPKPRWIEETEWKGIKKYSRDEGERLFKVFLHEALEYKDQLRIDADYNRLYNAVAPLQFNKIPIGLEISKKFKGFDLQISPAQSEGVAFIELVGSGIIAYDVGVGKTMTAIINVINALNSGRCKRPLIVCPNPTYKNWILEMFGDGSLDGILSGTGVTLNDWYNLGAGYDKVNLDERVKERSITLLTYEGLEKIGFNEFTSKDHFDELSNIVSQSDEGTERDVAKQNEKLREIVGVGNKDSVADIEILGFDFIVVDEAHNFKNVFSEVKSDKDGNKQFQIKGGQPSNRAIKLFFLTNYIQRTYGRNVVLLTATPFTNSPLEIYSMLSFVAYEYMKTWGIYNIRQFFEQYIQETSEYVVGIDGEIQQKTVVKSFNNRISLQKLINSHISFKTGEEANVPRPCKINIPKTTTVSEKEGIIKLSIEKQVLSYLKLTPLQQQNQAEINKAASEGASRDDPGKLLRLMSQSLNNALSPFLYDGKPDDYFDFVEESPKIKYTIECIKSVKEWHEKRKEDVSGQVIYIDRGKDFFPLIKEYLENELGYKKGVSLKSNPRLKVDEVEVVSSGISQTNKEKIKDAFNEGTCKIIIGTSTIKEGINLQKKSTVLYNLYPNWNPTDIRQLEGRIWRQGNKFGYVRVVMPLMENSMDVFVFQKLEEKTSRINDLWSKADRGNVLDEESLDPNEVKFALVTDLGVLQRFELKQIKKELQDKKGLLQGKINDLGLYVELSRKVENHRLNFFNKANDYFNNFAKNAKLWGGWSDSFYYSDLANLSENQIKELTKEKQNTIERFTKVYNMLNNVIQGYDDKQLIMAVSSYQRTVQSNNYDYQLENYKTDLTKYQKIKRTIFEQRGYAENTDLSVIRGEMEEELIMVDQEIENARTPEFEDKVMDNIIAQKQKYQIKGGELSDRVKDFERLNYLMSWLYDSIDKNTCAIPDKEYSKSNTFVKEVDADKERKMKIAIAKAKAIKIKLKLIA
jgi:hypothetical protein